MPFASCFPTRLELHVRRFVDREAPTQVRRVAAAHPRVVGLLSLVHQLPDFHRIVRMLRPLASVYDALDVSRKFLIQESPVLSCFGQSPRLGDIAVRFVPVSSIAIWSSCFLILLRSVAAGPAHARR